MDSHDMLSPRKVLHRLQFLLALQVLAIVCLTITGILFLKMLGLLGVILMFGFIAAHAIMFLIINTMFGTWQKYTYFRDRLNRK